MVKAKMLNLFIVLFVL